MWVFFLFLDMMTHSDHYGIIIEIYENEVEKNVFLFKLCEKFLYKVESENEIFLCGILLKSHK